MRHDKNSEVVLEIKQNLSCTTTQGNKKYEEKNQEEFFAKQEAT